MLRIDKEKKKIRTNGRGHWVHYFDPEGNSWQIIKIELKLASCQHKRSIEKGEK